MASKEELLASIQPGMKLTKNFFLKVYGYAITDPEFPEVVFGEFAWNFDDEHSKRAEQYYKDIVAEYQKKHDEEMKNVAAWYRKQDSNLKRESDKGWKKQREVEQLKADLQTKSDRELLILLQKLKAEKEL